MGASPSSRIQDPIEELAPMGRSCRFQSMNCNRASSA
jgi:hypothetical protein